MTWQIFLYASMISVLTTAVVCFFARRGYLDAPLSYLLSLVTAGWLAPRRHPEWGQTYEIDRGIELSFWTVLPLIIMPALVVAYVISKRVFK